MPSFLLTEISHMDLPATATGSFPVILVLLPDAVNGVRVFGLARGDEASGLCSHAPERLAPDATPETPKWRF